MTVHTFDHPAHVSDQQLGREERKRRTAQLIAKAHHAPAESREALLDEAVRINIPVARTLAGRYRNRGQSIEDLEQVACLALTRAVQAFTPERGDDLLVYAVPSILGELKRYFRDATWDVRPPRRLQELRPRLAAAEEQLTQMLGREPTDGELAEEVGSDEQQVREAAVAGSGAHAESLDRTVGAADGTGSALVDVLPVADGGFDRVEALTVLAPAWALLKGRDRRILRLRFYEERTQQQIADELGVSQVQVSRLLRRILDDLRLAMAGDRIGPVRA